MVINSLIDNIQPTILVNQSPGMHLRVCTCFFASVCACVALTMCCVDCVLRSLCVVLTVCCVDCVCGGVGVTCSGGQRERVTMGVKKAAALLFAASGVWARPVSILRLTIF